MPYRTVADLPKAQTDQYNAHQKEAAVAHAAAKNAGSRPGPG